MNTFVRFALCCVNICVCVCVCSTQPDTFSVLQTGKVTRHAGGGGFCCVFFLPADITSASEKKKKRVTSDGLRWKRSMQKSSERKTRETAAVFLMMHSSQNSCSEGSPVPDCPITAT